MRCIVEWIYVGLRVLWHVTTSDRCLSGFQRYQRQMLSTHFKGDILLAFGLDHFQDMIRFQHMAKEKHSKAESFEYEYFTYVGVALT